MGTLVPLARFQPDQWQGENVSVYCLEAVIAGEAVLHELAGSVQGTRVVPLGQCLWLLPMTDAFVNAVAVPGAPRLDGFWKAPPGFGGLLAACSALGPVAYVEAEIFGGTGTQSASVWDQGRVILGPLRGVEDDPTPPAETPIARALRQLGALAGENIDEFDAVGLGRHRQTEDWHSPATWPTADRADATVRRGRSNDNGQCAAGGVATDGVAPGSITGSERTRRPPGTR